MDKKQINSLTSYEITFILVGTVIGVDLLSNASNITKMAHQDGWISMLVGAIYPLYIVFIGTYIIKIHPKDNILIISKIYLGNILGTILNVIFLTQFVFYIAFVTSSIIRTLRTYNITLLSPMKAALVLVAIAAFAASKGVKTVAKINIVVFFFILALAIFSMMALAEGNILNVMPIGGAGVINILKGAEKSFYSYTSIEILLLIHPFAQESKLIKSAAFKAVFIICFIYTWIVFITIFYLGIEVINLSYWPSIMVLHSVHLPLINNFVTIFMLFWNMIFLKSITNQYYIITLILNDFSKINIKKICLFIFPIVIYFSLIFLNSDKFKDAFAASAVYFLIFNLSYVTILALLIFFKEKKINNSMKHKKTL